jgi:hypothetical protein
MFSLVTQADDRIWLSDTIDGEAFYRTGEFELQNSDV